MKLRGLTEIKFEQKKVSSNDFSVPCDYVLITIPEERGTTVYNLDQIFTVDPTSIFEQTFIDGNRISGQKGEEYHYMIIKFMNGEVIKVKGTLRSLEHD